MATLDFGALGEASAVLFGICGLILAFLARDIDRWPRGLCIALLASTVASGALSLMERAILQYPDSLLLFRGLYIAESLIKPLPSLLMFAFLLYSCGEDPRRSAIMRVLCVLTAAGNAAGLAALFTGKLGGAPDFAVQSLPRPFCILCWGLRSFPSP